MHFFSCVAECLSSSGIVWELKMSKINVCLASKNILRWSDLGNREETAALFCWLHCVYCCWSATAGILPLLVSLSYKILGFLCFSWLLYLESHNCVLPKICSSSSLSHPHCLSGSFKSFRPLSVKIYGGDNELGSAGKSVKNEVQCKQQNPAVVFNILFVMSFVCLLLMLVDALVLSWCETGSPRMLLFSNYLNWRLSAAERGSGVSSLLSCLIFPFFITLLRCFIS